jgi:DNA repair exonuclease SbcCD nuclease subunit
MAEDASAYATRRRPDANYHIALYHSEMVIPTVHLHRMGMKTIVNENTNIFKALNGVDLAIVGHVHKPIGTFRIDKSDGTTTTMIVPGSLTNTDAGLTSRHNTCDLPIIEIDEDGSVKISYHTLDLRTNELTFLRKELNDDRKQKLKSLRGNNKESLDEDLESTSFVGAEAEGFITLNAFIKQQGYTPTDKNLIKMVIGEPENIDKMIQIYRAEVTAEME